MLRLPEAAGGGVVPLSRPGALPLLGSHHVLGLEVALLCVVQVVHQNRLEGAGLSEAAGGGVHIDCQAADGCRVVEGLEGQLDSISDSAGNLDSRLSPSTVACNISKSCRRSHGI
jgi:hypothetical protein